MRRLFRQFSFPGGIPSHVAPETPGSIHEGGELGYALAHAYGAAFDNPDLLVCCVVGDGEAETGPLAASWHANKFLDPVHDGAVLPILHLNGYKIANPTVLARIPHEELAALLEGYGHHPVFVEGDDPATMHRQMAAALDEALDAIAEIQRARARGRRDRAAALADDRAAHAEGLDRARARATPALATRCRWPSRARRPAALAELEAWLRSYRPEELFDERRRRRATTSSRRRPRATAGWARTRTPTAACCCATCGCPTSATTPSTVAAPATTSSEATRVLGAFLRDVIAAQPAHVPAVRPGRDRLQPPRRGVRGHRPRLARRGAAGGRPPRARRPRDGGPQRAPLPGLAGGLPADRPPRALQLLRGVHPHRRLDVQPAREVAEGDARRSRGGGRSRRSTTCSPRTSGARTTTASRTRTRASSTTW